jgi:hypothetical protein
MNKIKVIDLLNMISKGEKAPKKIKINNVIYEYRGCMYCTEKANYQDIEDYLFGKWNFNILNKEVEILDEQKKIEKMECSIESWFSPSQADIEIIKKINELIDEINNLKEND